MSFILPDEVLKSSIESYLIDWDAITALPLDEWERTQGFSGACMWIQKIAKAQWSDDDQHFSQPQYTLPLTRLLRLIASEYCYSLTVFDEKKKDLQRLVTDAHNAEEAIRARAELLRRENEDLRELVTLMGKNQQGAKRNDFLPALDTLAGKKHDTWHTPKQHEEMERKIECLRRENSDLCRSLHLLRAEKERLLAEDAKFRLEYKHLVSRHKRLIEKIKKKDEILRGYQCMEKDNEEDKKDELHRLRRQVQTLQQEMCEAIRLRDAAEELCEKREADALRDMTELQQLHRDIVEEEKQRVQNLTMELERVQRDAENRLQEVVQGIKQEKKVLEEENNALQNRLKELLSSRRCFQNEFTEYTSDMQGNDLLSDNMSSLSSSSQRPFVDNGAVSYHSVNKKLRERLHQLQLENDRLSTELQQMEIKAEARDADNIKIQGILKEYERGDDGLRRLRNELAESNRFVELVQDENAQLRERLNAMNDLTAFSAALCELCIRIGVTQEEIDRLRPNGGVVFSEVEVLREEVRTLKDEVDWLEKERRHWMDKVRLQPLLDAKIRLELGLSQEQLHQLERMLNKMKSQKDGMGDFGGFGSDDGGKGLDEEEGEESYKKKYFQQLQLRRKEMEYFNDFVRHRLKEALQEALGKPGHSSAEEPVTALQLLQERVNLITARSLLDTSEEPQPDVAQLRVQLKSALQLLEQSEFTIKDNAASLAALREQLASVNTERDMLLSERDKYRAVVFEMLGAASSQQPFASSQKKVVTLNTERPASITPFSYAHPYATRNSVVASGNSALSAVLNDLQKSNESFLPNAPPGSILRTFEEQLLLKEELIASLKKSVEDCRNEMAQHRAMETKASEQLAESRATQDDLRNQVSVLQQINEELNEKLKEKTNTLADLQESISHIDSGNTRQLFQKIVLLRQREGKLVQRLRRVMETQEETLRSEREMRDYVNTTFKSLKEALENTSTGFVLPRSSAIALSMENDIIEEMRHRVDGALQGRLLKEDTAYLLQLQQVYGIMERTEELYLLRADLKNQRKLTEEMEVELIKQRVELESFRSLQQKTLNASVSDTSVAVRWEAEATTWRQKCDLYMRRLEYKEREASRLEAELGDARDEVALLREHIYKDDGYKNQNCNLKHVSQLQQGDQQEQPALLTSSLPGVEKKEKEEQEQEQEQPLQALTCEKGVSSNKVRQLEYDVARLKSINLGLLNHSLDIQGECRRIEIQLEATKQELFLVRETEGSRKVSDFVSAAIQQHAALRRQSELALLRAKRARIQLCATEANLRVAVNEATAYRLSAFRLYRTYVIQMVAVLDYIRSLHRNIKGIVSPHRMEMMHQRFLCVVADVERTQAQQNDMAARLAESSGTISLLQQQLELCKASEGEEQAAVLHAKLLTSLSAVREKDVQLAELQEDCRYMQQKLTRAEIHTKQLTEELARLELRVAGVDVFDGDIMQKLLQLKETVFAKAVSPAIVIHPTGVSSRDTDDPDTDAAIREYRQALDKQAELAKECSLLKKQLNGETAETRRARAEAGSLKEETVNLRERLQYAQQQLQDERRKSEERQQRVIRSHEAQAEVIRRTAEHNSQCLKEMLRNKEECIQHLQDQLTAERQKYLEYQLEESARMEKLHEHLFKDNKVMLERFREAIGGVAENYTFNTTLGAGMAQPDGVAEQLTLLTKETMRLKLELKEARATNILLEAQLNEQVSNSQKQLLQQTSRNGQQVPQVTLHAEASVIGIINDQNAIIESLRQRECNLTCEVQRYRKERDLMEQQLHEARQFVVKQGGVLKDVAVIGAGTSAVEQELRLQLTFVEKQLSETQAQLEEERQNVLRLQADTSQWRSHLDALHGEVVMQQADVERARHLVEMNKSLNEEIRRIEEQHQKLIMATKILKQRLLEQSQERGESLRKQQHELALAQRMGVIQMESSEQLKVVTERLNSIQQELENKVRREEEALKKHEEAQAVAYDLHKKLQEREEELLRIKGELAAFYSARSTVAPGRHEKGTQVLHTLQEGVQLFVNKGVTAGQNPPAKSEKEKLEKKLKLPQDTLTSPLHCAYGLSSDDSENILAKPHVAAALRRELERAQRDNTHEISSLRATVRRLETDLEDACQQLQKERDNNRSLRATLQKARREFQTKRLLVARESVARQEHLKEHKHTETQTVIETGNMPVSGSVVDISPSSREPTLHLGSKLVQQQEENEKLKRQVEQLKKRLMKLDGVVTEAERYKKEIADICFCQPEFVDAAHMASPIDIRSHKRIVIHLEGVIESLRWELNVKKETEVRNLQRRIDVLTAENLNLTAELSCRSQVFPGLQSLPTPLKTENVNGREALERELLEKNDLILDLRFEREALQLKVGRMERHINDILSVDSANAKHIGTVKQRGRVEALESVVENMTLVVERLQNENNMLKTKTVPVSKHMDLLRELRELRVSEQKLREHSEMLTKRLVGLVPSGSAMSKQQAKLYRKLQTAYTTMEQYQTEMLELKQKLEEYQQKGGDDMTIVDHCSHGEAHHYEDRRTVQPLDDTCSSSLPPPLPDAPVRSFSFGM